MYKLPYILIKRHYRKKQNMDGFDMMHMQNNNNNPGGGGGGGGGENNAGKKAVHVKVILVIFIHTTP